MKPDMLPQKSLTGDVSEEGAGRRAQGAGVKTDESLLPSLEGLGVGYYILKNQIKLRYGLPEKK